MRSRSLIKKVGVVLLATMLLASIGLTGYADIIDGANAGQEDLQGNVSATVSVTDINGGYGFYKVTVEYNNDSAASTVGITMLAYAETANDTADGFESGDISAGYDETLQIVGIDQTEVTDSGTFNFLVNTNPDTTSGGAIRMDRGDVGIVLLSADGALAPTGYLFTIPAAEEFTVTVANPEVESVPVLYGTSVEDVKAQLDEVSITVSGDTVTERGWTASGWTFEPEYSATTPGTYTATGSLVIPTGSKAILDTVTTVSIPVVVADATAVWNAAVAQAIVDPNGNAFTSIPVTVAAGASASDIEDAIKAYLLNPETVGGITIYSHEEGEELEEGEVKYGARVAIDNAIAESLTLVEDTTYMLTIPADATVIAVLGEKVIMPEDGLELYFDVAVTEDGTIEPDPDVPTDSFDATDIKAVDGSDAVVTAIEVENGTSVTDAIATLPTKAIVYGAEGETEEWTITGWTIDGYDGATAADYTATATLEAPADSVANLGNLTLTVTVTVKAAEGGDDGDQPTVVKGDCDGDGEITASDLGAVKRHVMGSVLIDQSNQSGWAGADVDGDGDITAADLGAIKRHVMGTSLITQ